VGQSGVHLKSKGGHKKPVITRGCASMSDDPNQHLDKHRLMSLMYLRICHQKRVVRDISARVIKCAPYSSAHGENSIS